MAGRHSKQTPERVERLLTALREGNTRINACRLAGISDQTLADWQRKSLDFLAQVKSAEADAEAAHVANIRRASLSGEWTASAWWLERRRPQDWGKVERVEVTLRKAAEKLATELGFTVEDVLAEADRLVGGGSR